MRFSLVFLFLLISCAGVKPISAEPARPKMSWDEIMPEKVAVQNGRVAFAEFKVPHADGEWELACGKNFKKIPYFVKSNIGRLYLAESYFSKRKNYTCKDLVSGRVVLDVHVTQYKYKSERLNVPKRRVDLKGKDLERAIREKTVKKNIYKKSAKSYLFESEFKVPLNSKLTSIFGNKRLFNNKKQSQHLGYDFRAAVGVPIPVSNKGVVVFSGNLFFSGNVVVIDHGLDIFTMYAHLSKIQVSKGDIVNKGDIVGLAGKTGRVSGPHLHWGVKVQGHWVDGFSMTDASKIHFKK